MRRADRLFEIIQVMRRRKLTRARDLAQHLEVSERTIYRDIGDLVAGGVPIAGEAGVGYMLEKGYDLPPLMFTEAEIEALVLGARIVESWADPGLAAAAGSVLAKVETVVPERLRRHMAETPLIAPANHWTEPLTVDPAVLRGAVRDRRKIGFGYCDAEGRVSERCVRPLALSFYGPIWLLVAWCETRRDFRCFRLDRMADVAVLGEAFEAEPGKTFADFLARDAASAPPAGR